MVYLRSQNWNRNLSKVGTGTVKNSYGSATLLLSTLGAVFRPCRPTKVDLLHFFLAFLIFLSLLS
jgi:hypothetical protein